MQFTITDLQLTIRLTFVTSHSFYLNRKIFILDGFRLMDFSCDIYHLKSRDWKDDRSLSFDVLFDFS